MGVWILALPLTLCWSQAKWDLAQKVTYSTEAKSAKNICAELTKLTKIPLETALTTSSEVLYVDVKNVPVSELMNRIAQVTDAKWEQGKDYYRLDRSDEIDRKQRNDEIEEDAKRIGLSLQKVQKEVARYKDVQISQLKKVITEYYDFRRQSEDGNANYQSSAPAVKSFVECHPVNRLLNRMIVSLDAKELATIHPGERIIYSTLPTQAQRSIGASAVAEYQKFAQEWTSWIGLMNWVPDDSYQEDYELARGFASGQTPMKANLSCRRDAISDEISVSLTIVSDRLGMLASASRDISFAFEPAHSDKPSRPFRLTPSKLTKEWTENVETVFRGSPVASTDAFRRWILNPERFDPLSLLPSEVIQTITQSRMKNVVVNIPDQAMKLQEFINDSQPKWAEVVEDFMKSDCNLAFREEGDWLIGKPIKPYQSRRERLNRSALAVLHRNLQRNHVNSLEDMATFVASNTRQSLELENVLNNRIWSPNHRDMVYKQDFLRLYASLSNGQRRILSERGALAFSELNPSQLDLVAKVCYERYEQHDIEVSKALGKNALLSALEDATEAFPRGIPLEGKVTFERTGEQPVLVLCDSLIKGPMLSDMYAMALAWQRFEPDSPDLKDVKLDSLISGKAYLAHIAININNQFMTGGGANVVELDFSQPILYHQLADSMRIEIDKHAQEFYGSLMKNRQ